MQPISLLPGIQLIDANGRMTRDGMNLFQALVNVANAMVTTQPVPEYTVATVPTAAEFPASSVIVSDEAGGRTLATSDGTNWRRVSDGAVIS